MALRWGVSGLRRLLQQTSRSSGYSQKAECISIGLPNPETCLPLSTFATIPAIPAQTIQCAPLFPAPFNAVPYASAAAGCGSVRTLNTAGFAATTDSSRSGSASDVKKPKPAGSGSRNKTRKKPDRRNTIEGARDRLALIPQLRAWPVDVDLCEKFPTGQFAGHRISAYDLRSVLYTFANAPRMVGGGVGGSDAAATAGDVDSTAGDTEATAGEADATGGNAETTSSNANVTAGDADATGGKTLTDTALRALNLFNWWEARGQSRSDMRRVLHPLLKCLAVAGMRDEIRSLWQRWQPNLEPEDIGVLQFMAACLQVQLYDDVIAIVESSKEQEWLMKGGGLDTAIRTMQAKGCSANEAWEFYRTWVEKLGNDVCQRPGFVALLELGISVEQIQTLTDDKSAYVQNRLVQALSTLGRRDEARALVIDYINGHKESPLGVSTMVSYLRTLIQSGFVQEAQQLADQQEKLGVTLKGAVVYILNQGESRWTGLDTYRELQALEGSHKQSTTVQALLITKCLKRLDDTEAMYKAYLLGKQFDGHFHSLVYARVIECLAQDGRQTEAEGVLADYYEARRTGSVAPLRISAFQSMGHMYLQTDQPHKLVELVNGMVKQKTFMGDWITERWITRLRAGDHLAEAQQVRDAQTRMREIADAYGERRKHRLGGAGGNGAGDAAGNGNVGDGNSSDELSGTEDNGTREAAAEEGIVEGVTTTSEVREAEGSGGLWEGVKEAFKKG